ncbi:MAG: RHS repeat-associated core domain-containing protein [Acidobacteriia bacterium]|nr:RHS repeat-associated core domain-containing protein [Terriglobia bacterium]
MIGPGAWCLYYYRARYYDPNIGRFLSEDPIRFDGGPNFYAYTANDPVSKIDLTGLAPCDSHDRNCLNNFINTVQNLFPGSTYDANSNTLTLPQGYNNNQVIQALQHQGYLDGVSNFAWNPIDHAGGHEFRVRPTGFHFKVKYLPSGTNRCQAPVQMDDFHIDDANPLNDPLGHAIEFLNYHNLVPQPIGPVSGPWQWF